MASKMVTVLFSDLVSSTQIVGEVGDTVASTAFRTHLSSVRDLVEQRDGTLVKFIGDGALAWFDSATAAIDCAVDLQRSSYRGDSRLPQELEIRIGLSAGEVIMADDDVYGSVVVEAARLCDRAGSGQILCSQIVVALAGSQLRHPHQTLEPLSLKGIDVPVVPVEIEWSRDEAGPELPPGLRRIRQAGPCLDRDHPLDKLRRAAGAVETGTPRMALIVGEAGIGKSCLAAAFAQRASGEGARVLHGVCDPQVRAAYQPWVSALAPLAESLPPEVRAQTDPDGHLGRILPGGDAEPLDAIGAAAARQELFTAVQRLLAGDFDGPLTVVVLDDTHWIDPSSVSLMRHLLRSDGTGRILVVACSRPSGLADDAPMSELVLDLARDGVLDRIEIDGIGAEAVAELVRRSGVAGDEAEVTERVHAISDGNPFFVTQVLASIGSDGELAGQVTVADLPTSVRQLVGVSLRDVDSGLRPLLDVAAVYGRPFRVRELARFSGVDRSTCVRALDAGLRAEILLEHEDGTVAFRHDLIREVVASDLSGPVRSEMHWQIGTALQEDGRDVTHVATHLCDGASVGDPDRASEAALVAAERAAGQSAFELTAQLARLSQATMDAHDVQRPDLRARALIALAESALVVLDEDVDAASALVDAADIARQSGDSELMRRVAVVFTMLVQHGNVDPRLAGVAEEVLRSLPHDDPARSGVLATVGLAQFLRGDVAGGEVAVSEAVATADRSGSDYARSLAYSAQAALDMQRPDAAALGRATDVALEAAAAVGNPPWVSQSRIRAIMHAARIGDRALLERRHERYTEQETSRLYPAFGLMLAGTLAMADGHYDRAEQGARALVAAVPPSSLIADTAIAHLAACLGFQGRSDEAAELMASIPYRQPGLTATVTIRRAYLAASAGRRDEATELLAEVLESGEEPFFEFYLGSVLHDLGETALLLEADDLAEDLVQRLEAFAGQILVGGGMLAIWGPADEVRGRLLGRIGRLDEGIEAARAGLALAEGFGARAVIARAQCSLAELLGQRGGAGDVDAARDLLDQALACVADHEGGVDRRRIETMLNRVG